MQYRYRNTRPEIPPPVDWIEYLDRCYETRWFTNFGEVSRAFERGLSKKFCQDETNFVATSSGTLGIAAALIAHEIRGPVICPAFTFTATTSAVRMAGAEPVLADVDANYWQISAATLDAAFLATGAKCAVLVAPFGMRRDLSEHQAVASARGGVLIIDNAAGLGVQRSLDDARLNISEVFSLHATKPFGIGEGGIVLCSDALADRIRSAINFGFSLSHGSAAASWGVNGKMSEFHSAIGLAVLKRIEARVAARKSLVARYKHVLSAYPEVQMQDDIVECPWQVFPMLMPTGQAADGFISAAAALGMEVRKYYSPSLSQDRAIRMVTACPISERLAERMCCVPVYSSANRQEAEELARILDDALCSTFETTGARHG